MKRGITPLLCICLVLAGCPKGKNLSSPAPSASSPAKTSAPKSPGPSATEAPFDPNSITLAMKQEAFIDITALIKELNRITQNRDYEAWKTYLAKDLINKYSDVEFLLKLSQFPMLKQQGIVLKTLRDYFDFVVYPSHQNDRVDDIEFIGNNRVYAIVRSKKGERLVLWTLEKIGGSWKIAGSGGYI